MTHNASVRPYSFIIGLVGFLGLLGFPIDHASAAPASLLYRYKHHLFTIAVPADWRSSEEVWTLNGKEVTPPQHLRVDGDDMPAPVAGFVRSTKQSWNRNAIARVITERIGAQIEQDAGSVTIGRNGSGSITFDGAGFPGRKINMDTAVNLTIAALDQNVRDIHLPITETPPQVTVTDDELRERGIKELVTIGESDFTGSTQNRIHNVTTGLNKFSGHLIEQGETFSFVKVLGPVDATTGYRKELTIVGDKTIPEYGGGLCQVSSTAYRGVWEYGFPITQRKNHSYTVSYYSPQGTDATVYPPNIDIKFLNDSPGALLIQTVIDVPEKNAYFLYYGTKDNRTADVIGPFTWGHTPAPPPRTEETTEIAPGTRRKVGEAVPGMRAAWFRTVKQNGETETQGTYSIYQARPLYWQIGVAHLSAGTGSLSDAPATETVISN